MAAGEDASVPERLSTWSADLDGEDLYLVLDDRLTTPPVPGPDTRIRDAIEADLAAAHHFDPLDMLDPRVVDSLWEHEGAALLHRQDEVAEVAASNGWEFAALDADLSAHLVETDITAGAPRVTRNVCTAPAGPYIADLTGATYRLGTPVPEHVHLRTATAGVVPFPSDHRLAAVPAHAVPAGWIRFGQRVETGVEDFDRSYHVYAHQAGWVRRVLNPAMMARLLDHQPITLVLAADQLAVIHPRWVPAEALTRFRDFVAQTAFSAAAAHGHDSPLTQEPARAHLSGWSAWAAPSSGADEP